MVSHDHMNFDSCGHDLYLGFWITSHKITTLWNKAYLVNAFNIFYFMNALQCICWHVKFLIIGQNTRGVTPMSIKVAMRLSKTFFCTCIASMAWGPPSLANKADIERRSIVSWKVRLRQEVCFYLCSSHLDSSFHRRCICFSPFCTRVLCFDVSPERVQSPKCCHKI